MHELKQRNKREKIHLESFIVPLRPGVAGRSPIVDTQVLHNKREHPKRNERRGEARSAEQARYTEGSWKSGRNCPEIEPLSLF